MFVVITVTGGRYKAHPHVNESPPHGPRAVPARSA
jgi:hypothetical protein